METGKQYVRAVLYVYLFLTCATTFSHAKFSKNPYVNLDSMRASIQNHVGKEKTESILRFCLEFLHKKPGLCLEYVKMGLDLATAQKDAYLKRNLLERKGIAEIKTGSVESGLQNIQEAMDLGQEVGDSILLGRAYSSLGHGHYILGKYEKSRNYYENSIKILEKLQNHPLLLKAKMGFANSFVVIGAYEKALELYEDIFLLCDKSNQDCIGLLINKGIVLKNIGRPSEGLTHFFKAKKEFLARKDTFGLRAAEHHIGFLLQEIGLLKEALKYYLPVETYYFKSGDVNRLSHIQMNLGGIMLELDSLDRAQAFLLNSMALKTKHGIKNLVDHYTYLAEIAAAKDSLDKAKYYLDLAIQSSEESGNTRGKLGALNVFSSVCLQERKYEKAEELAKEVLALNKGVKAHIEYATAYENLFNVYSANKKFEQAISVKIKLDSINKELQGPKELLEISQQLVQDALRENERTQKKRLNPTEPAENFGWRELVSGILILLLIIFILYKEYGKRKSPQNSISSKEKVPKKHISSLESKELLYQLEQVIREKEPYLNEQLTLRELANLVPTTDKKLSALLNHELGTNFYDYLNKLRVETFKKKWTSGKYNNYSILGLAQTCGFSSKSSFYRAFKKEAGISPSEFMKNSSR